jgi:hypothetical protein
MLSKSLQKEIAADPHFRLVINQAVNSKDALSSWIVRRTLHDQADDSVSCTFGVSTKKISNPIPLTFTRKKCSDDSSTPASLAKEFHEIRVPLNNKPVYIPDLDAYVGVEAERGGFLHWGAWHSATGSVQSAAYSDRKVKPAPASTKLAGKQAASGATSNGPTSGATTSPPSGSPNSNQPSRSVLSDARLDSH